MKSWWGREFRRDSKKNSTVLENLRCYNAYNKGDLYNTLVFMIIRGFVKTTILVYKYASHNTWISTLNSTKRVLSCLQMRDSPEARLLIRGWTLANTQLTGEETTRLKGSSETRMLRWGWPQGRLERLREERSYLLKLNFTRFWRMFYW